MDNTYTNEPSKANAERVAATVKGQHPIFQEIRVVEDENSFDYQYRTPQVQTPVKLETAPTGESVQRMAIQNNQNNFSINQISYGSSDLSQQIINHRKTLGLERGKTKSNFAIFEYEDESGALHTIMKKSEFTKGHAERLIHNEIQNMGIDASKVKRIYSERQPCILSGCSKLLKDNYKNAAVTYSFEYEDKDSRAKGNSEMEKALELLFSN
jgi:hypothetical protein